MLLVCANRVAHRAVSGSWSVLRGFSARGELVLLLLLEQVVVPIVLLPLCVHVDHRWRATVVAESEQFEQES